MWKTYSLKLYANPESVRTKKLFIELSTPLQIESDSNHTKLHNEIASTCDFSPDSDWFAPSEPFRNFPLVLYRRLDIFPTHKLRSTKLRDARQIETINLSRLYAAPRTDIFYILMKRPHTTPTHCCVDKIKAFCLFYRHARGKEPKHVISINVGCCMKYFLWMLKNGLRLDSFCKYEIIMRLDGFLRENLYFNIWLISSFYSNINILMLLVCINKKIYIIIVLLFSVLYQ